MEVGVAAVEHPARCRRGSRSRCAPASGRRAGPARCPGRRPRGRGCSRTRTSRRRRRRGRPTSGRGRSAASDSGRARGGWGRRAASCSAAKTWTSASGKSGSPPAWSRSRWVGTMWRTSAGVEAERPDLLDRRLRRVGRRAETEREREPEVAGRVARSPRARSRCRRGSASRRPRSAGSGRQISAVPPPETKRAAVGTHRAAVEVVDLHRARHPLTRRPCGARVRAPGS